MSKSLIDAQAASAVSRTAQPFERLTLQTPRRGHSTTLLADGRAIIIGGENQNGPLNEAEVLDPRARRITVAARSITPRFNHTATLLTDGRILLIGGAGVNGALASSEFYDPEAKSFLPGPRLSLARVGHSATMLSDGRILISGGRADGSAEIFDPAAGRFNLLNAKMGASRSLHGAVLLQNGDVLVAGGVGQDGRALETAEVFDGRNQSFTLLSHWMHAGRIRPTLRLLPDGKVQAIGGDSKGTIETYDPEMKNFRGFASLLSLAYSPLSSNLLNARARANLSQAKALTAKLGPKASGPGVSRSGVNDELFNRAEYTTTEIPQAKLAVIAGGVDQEGRFLSTVILMKSSSATVTTDKTLYFSEDRPVISGQGWGPSERILIFRQEAQSGKRTVLQSVADNQGKFVNTDLSPGDYRVGVNYVVTAIGQTSGYVSEATYKDATPIKPEKATFDKTIRVKLPTKAGKGNSLKTEAGLLKWKTTSSGAINLAAVDPSISGGVDLPTDPCLGLPISCDPLDVRFLSGRLDASAGIDVSLDIDISISCCERFLGVCVLPCLPDIDITGGVTLSESLSANGVIQVAGTGSKTFSGNIPTPIGISFDIAGIVSGSIGLTVFVAAEIGFTEPSTIQVGFDFGQEITRMGITTSEGAVFETGDNHFNAEIKDASGGTVCGKVSVGPQIGVELTVHTDVPGIDDVDVGSAFVRVDGFVRACITPNVVRESCINFNAKIGVGVEGVVSAELIGFGTGGSFTFFETELFNDEVILRDTEGPVLMCPTSPIMLPTARPIDDNFDFTLLLPTAVKATDSCQRATIAAKCAGSNPKPGLPVTLTCTATDKVGNTSSCSFALAFDDGKCATVCFRSPTSYRLNLPILPPGVSIEIGGLNFGAPTRNQSAIKLALQGGSSPLQQLNERFVAAQLSLVRAGGHSSLQVVSALGGHLSCNGLSFKPIALSNGVNLSVDSTLRDLFDQARRSMRENRTVDMLALVKIFDLLNSNSAVGRCGP